MNIGNNYTLQRRKLIRLSDSFLCCIAFWPLLWNVWSVLKITVSFGYQIPLYFLWTITVLVLIVQSRIKRTALFFWIIFLGVVLIESFSRISVVINDLSVIFCGFIICALYSEKQFDYKLLLKCLFYCGFVISISVVLDNTFGIFKEQLINLYTENAASVKLRLTNSGGLLPHTGSSGCYIYSGVASFIVLAKINGKKLKRVNNILILSVFILASIMIQKRGFILDVIVAYLGIRVFRFRKEKLKIMNFNRNIRFIISLVILSVISVFIYFKVPLVNDAVTRLIGRFTENDESLSGRTALYELAFSLYRGHVLTGIGWGKYRLNTVGFFGLSDSSYAVHNVYIQLLCETGILGLSSFLLASISSLILGVKKYRKIICSELDIPEKQSVEIGLFFQLFFLSYCMSGNPLYDYNFCIIYFIGILFTLIPVDFGEKAI